MKQAIRTLFEDEMLKAKRAYSDNALDQSFYHFERAHILGQRYFLAHWITHWWMLKIGFLKKDSKEIRGQFLRLLAVTPGFLTGWVPKGNTGGANVFALKPMAYPDDLEEILEGYSVTRDVLLRLLALGFIGFCLWFSGFFDAISGAS